MVRIGLLTTPEGHYIGVEFPYNKDMLNRIYKFPDRHWDSVNRRWIISIIHLPTVKSLFPEAELSDGIRSYHSDQHQEAEKKREEFNELISGFDLEKPLPDGRILFKHQREAVMRLLHNRRQILALDMGLGKTLVALMAAKIIDLSTGYRTVIICPVSLKENWQREAESIDFPRGDFSIHSWSKLPEPLSTPYILIADEAHYAQAGTKSQRGKAFLELANNARCYASYCLTGTPMKNGRPINLLPLLIATRHKLSRDKRYFHIRYCDAKKTTFSRWDTNGAKNLDELNRMVQDVMIRKTKDECLDLPPKIRVLRQAELSPKSKALYETTLSDLKAQFKAKVQDGEISPAEALVMLNHLRHAGSVGKAETAVELAQEVVEEGGQVVIFTEYLKSANMIHDDLNRMGIRAELLTGSTTDRQGVVDRFQSGRTKVFVGTIKAGGVGLTLTKAQTVLLVDRPWTPGDTEQAEDRCHRIGQAGSVTAIWLQYGAMDEKIDKLLQEKRDNISIVLQGTIAKELFA